MCVAIIDVAIIAVSGSPRCMEINNQWHSARNVTTSTNTTVLKLLCHASTYDTPISGAVLCAPYLALLFGLACTLSVTSSSRVTKRSATTRSDYSTETRT